MSMFRVSVAGDYRFALMNGEVKSLVFNASYCRATKPKFANAI